MGAERGAATVEFALFAMFLILIVCGIVDLGRGLYTAIALDDAVQEGVIYAAFTDDLAGTEVTADDIKARVVASTSSPQLSVDDVTVTCVDQVRSKQSAGRITVEVTHTVDLITPFIADWFGGTLTLERQAVADRFFAACPAGTTP
ncbi:MAG TPA: TadE/TadG family type IV pilus assembly protein [Acidimicrobiia bacterium]|nr:TadE/TadG family type IV pilus assembly protein [Acidimicrobiia bacterium]